MARNRVCDFCLDELKGLFNYPEQLPDKHYICSKCKQKIQYYKLPLRYEIFQLLVTSEPSMRDMMMGTYLESHDIEDCYAKFYPTPNVLLHKGEHCINTCPTSIRVDTTQIPTSLAVTNISDITSRSISNLTDVPEQPGSTVVKGTLYHTDNALYFLSEHFINCHKLTNIVRNSSDNHAIHVIEGNKRYTYPVEFADLFFLREAFYQKMQAKSSKKKNLIYVASENTMTLTPGVYSVPKNIQAGSYWVSAIKDKGLRVRDAAGNIQGLSNGRIILDEGSMLEVTGEYQFRIHPKQEKKKEILQPMDQRVQESTQVIVKQRDEMSDDTKLYLNLPDDMTKTLALPLMHEDDYKK